MRRICCFCETWESGGIESFLNNVLLHMDLSEMEVDIVAACVKESVFTQGLKDRGVHFIKLSGTLRSFRNYRLFRNLLRERRYDVVHFNLFQGLSLYYVQIAKEEGVPVRIAHSHNTALRKSRGRALKMLLHKAGSGLYTKSATDFWACSKNAGDFLFSGKASARFIPNGIDTNRFRFNFERRNALRTELGVENTFVIGNIGRLCYQKNQDFLLDVFAEFVKRNPQSVLLLVGDGDAKETLQEKAAKLGIAAQVIFYGVTNCAEQLYWAMDVLVMPSRFEGLPVTSVEAQATGLPCVFSNAITRECDLFNAAFLPLEAGYTAWVDAIEKQFSGERLQAAALVREAGFDTKMVARLVETYYLRQGRT